MRHLVTFTLALLLISNIYILQMNKKAAVKRRAFRWWMVIFTTLATVYFAFTVPDKALLAVVLLVLAGVAFGLLRFTKFCEWCGRVVKTNLPFGDKNRCPRCGSAIS